MKMTRRNFLSTSAVAALACGASLTAHAAGSTDENSLNFITDIFKDSTQPGEIEEATAITAEKNAEWYEKLDFSDRREFANAERGWLDNAEGRIIDGEDNRSAWDLQSYGDLNRDAPDTVNPSLWRNTQLNAKAGLFEVCDGIYQVRGFDMANTTFIRTDHGWIVFDVLMCRENMKAAKELMENRFGPLEIKAVLYSHSHVDHFGGVEGIIDRAQAPPETIPATAPVRFVLLQNSDITTVGPNAAPRPAHALDTSPMILLFGFHAITNARTDTTITVNLATARISFESASFLMN